MAKSNKLYKDSPELKKDEEGKVSVKKPSEASKVDIGAAGNPLPGAGEEMPVHTEHQEMMERHASEIKDMHKRHGKEHDKLMEKHSMKDGETGKSEPEKKETK